MRLHASWDNWWVKLLISDGADEKGTIDVGRVWWCARVSPIWLCIDKKKCQHVYESFGTKLHQSWMQHWCGPTTGEPKCYICLAIVHSLLTKINRFFLNLFTIPTWLIRFWFDNFRFSHAREHAKNKNRPIIFSLTMMDFMAMLQSTIKTRL
jgi:hypothetical protein